MSAPLPQREESRFQESFLKVYSPTSGGGKTVIATDFLKGKNPTSGGGKGPATHPQILEHYVEHGAFLFFCY